MRNHQKPSSSCTLYKACTISRNVLHGRGVRCLCQLFKEPLVHSMHSEHKFFSLEQGQQLDTPTNAPEGQGS